MKLDASKLHIQRTARGLLVQRWGLCVEISADELPELLRQAAEVAALPAEPLPSATSDLPTGWDTEGES